MLFDAFDKNCTEGTGRTHILACTAAQATFGIYHGNARRIVRCILFLYHFNCSVGTVTLAVVATDTILVGYTVVGNPHSGTYLCRAFLFGNDGLYCSVGADVGTGGACGTAEAALERHFGLHQTVEAARWAQHVIGTF